MTRSSNGQGEAIGRLLMLAILLLALGLRVFRLDQQSLWSDEGISLLRSSLPLAEMLRTMPVEHVPGYFVLLHFWLRVAGTLDYALRFLSVWPSVLAVAMIARLGRDMAGPHADDARSARFSALAAALLLTTGAFQIWYAQEVRMYSWLLLTSLASAWFLWRLLVTPHGRWWLFAAGYIATVTASIYTHYYGFLTPLAHTIFAVGWAVVTRNWRAFARWAGCGLIVLLLFLPWAPRAIAVNAFPGWRDPGQPWQIPWRYLTAYTAFDSMPQLWRSWVPLLYAGLAGLGAWSWWHIRRAASLFLLVSLLVPLVAVFLLALRNPDFHERYAIALSGPLLLLCAGGLATFERLPWRRTSSVENSASFAGRTFSVVLLIALITLNGLALIRLYTDETFHRPDFKGAAWRIENSELPGEVILVDGPDPEKVFMHYYDGPNPVHDLRFLEGEPWEVVDAYLTEATAGAMVAWELLYFHDPGPVQVWLATRAWPTAPSDHNDIRVIKYGLPGPPLISSDLNVHFGDALTLERAELPADPLRPGEVLRVSSHWFTQASPPEYKFSLRLVDDADTVVLARDYVPQNGFAPTNVWIVGQPASDQRGLLLPVDLRPGRYKVTVRLYDPATGTAVESTAGQDVALGEIQVIAPPISEP